jgi:hypothetical protein
MENIPSSTYNEAVLVNRIYTLRRQSTIERLDFVQDRIFQFDKELKSELLERQSSTQVLQQIAPWQALIGGSLELETDISPADKKFVEDKIATFVDILEQELKNL